MGGFTCTWSAMSKDNAMDEDRVPPLDRCALMHDENPYMEYMVEVTRAQEQGIPYAVVHNETRHVLAGSWTRILGFRGNTVLCLRVPYVPNPLKAKIHLSVIQYKQKELDMYLAFNQNKITQHSTRYEQRVGN